MRPVLNNHQFGPWAVVTGSSSGIGRAIARHPLDARIATRALPGK
jgi:NAD(P)-dependent dehydrogenase (short-subunit alcohol dehydrogenase family)